MESETRDDETVQDSFAAIGAELASARLERGMQITELAQLLRISRHYLKALEAGDHSNLPGATYVSGYIRSVAREIGLDGEAMSQRYRGLLDKKSEKPAYQFPIDNQQPQRSGAMIASIIVIFGVGGYGGWYAAGKPDLTAGLLGSEQPEVASVMPQVEITVTEPDNLIAGDADTLQVATSPAAPAVAETDADAAGAATYLAAAAPVDAGLDTPAGGVDADTGDALAAVEAPADDQPADDAALTDLAAIDTGAAATGTSATGTSETLQAPELGPAADIAQGDVPAADQATGAALLEDTGLAASAATLEATPEDTTGAADIAASDAALQPATTTAQTEAATDEVAAVDSETDTVSRGGVAFARQRLPEQEITVRATGISWVEIIRNDGEEVMTKLMREGEVYVVDSRDKLYLSTGNAGGLELLFHDGSVRAVGESGEILRDLPLDADRLRNQL